MSTPYSQSSPHTGHQPVSSPPPSSGTGAGAGMPSGSQQPQQYATSPQQTGQQVFGSMREKAHDISQKAQETAQYAASQVKESVRHPSRASPYLIPILAFLLICGASVVPLSLMLGKSAKDKIASAYDESGYGYGRRDVSSMVRDKWDAAKDALFGQEQGSERGAPLFTDDRSFGEKILGRRPSMEEMKYHGQRIRDETEHGVGDLWHRAKEKVFGTKESAEEEAAGGSEFVLQSIDALSDKLHELRKYYVGRTREEKPAGWLRHAWDNILDGMHSLRMKSSGRSY